MISPANSREATPENAGDQPDDYAQTPGTPGSTFNFDNFGMSPATPFYLSQKANLVQQTCPPKQTRQGLFNNSPSADDGLSSQRLRFKLEAARRKSLAFKPRIQSPLAE